MSTLNDILSQIDKNGKCSIPNWCSKLKWSYAPFISQVYPNLEDQAMLKKSRRIQVLFTYWAMNKVTTVEEAKASIPVCRYCGKELAMPRSSEPIKEGDEWIVSCRCKECAKKYNRDQTDNGTERKYGVRNISSLPEMKIKRSKIMSDLYKTERGDEANKKRVQTLVKRYGDSITNVSQLKEVQESKERTFNSTAYNSLNDKDKKYLDSLSEHSKYSLLVFKKFEKLNGKDVVLNNKTFSVMDPTEETFLRYISEFIKTDVIESNMTVMENIVNGVARSTIIDVSVNNMFFFEIKSNAETFHKIKLERYRSIANLKENQWYAVYIMDTLEKDAIFINNEGKETLFTTLGNDNDIINKFNIVGKSYKNIADMNYTITRIMISKLPYDTLTEKGIQIKNEISQRKSLKQ